MDDTNREKRIKSIYLKLLAHGNAELSLLMTRCLVPNPEKGRIDLDFIRFNQELKFYEYLQNKGEWSTLSLLLPLCLVQNSISSIIETERIVGETLGIKQKAAWRWGLYLFAHLVYYGKVDKEDVLGCEEALDSPQDNIQFQRMRIATLGKIEDAPTELGCLFQDQSSYGKTIESLLEKEKIGFEESAKEHHRQMAEYLWKIKNFKLKRVPLRQVEDIDEIWSYKEGEKGFFSILGEFEIAKLNREQKRIQAEIKTKRGMIAITKSIGEVE